MIRKRSPGARVVILLSPLGLLHAFGVAQARSSDPSTIGHRNCRCSVRTSE